ncbi:hypothetical protein H0H92_012908 [Tricholoma furcatifolium]|nr:hypothetical protein H0H92_012908 [Tricholoma furcatifolium]
MGRWRRYFRPLTRRAYYSSLFHLVVLNFPYALAAWVYLFVFTVAGTTLLMALPLGAILCLFDLLGARAFARGELYLQKRTFTPPSHNPHRTPHAQSSPACVTPPPQNLNTARHPAPSGPSNAPSTKTPTRCSSTRIGEPEMNSEMQCTGTFRETAISRKNAWPLHRRERAEFFLFSFMIRVRYCES